MNDVIQFDCVVNKVQTLADGGIRVTLDLAETEIVSMAALAQCKANEIVLQAQLTPIAAEIKHEQQNKTYS